MVFISFACSEKDEDIAAPSISILLPKQNDTIDLSNGPVRIKVAAEDHVSVDDMEMVIKDNAGTVLYSYDEDDIEVPSYNCNEEFYPEGITKVTQMKLTATFKNEYENWTTESVTFYVKP
jgi:hypothetical protein